MFAARSWFDGVGDTPPKDRDHLNLSVPIHAMLVIVEPDHCSTPRKLLVLYQHCCYSLFVWLALSILESSRILDALMIITSTHLSTNRPNDQAPDIQTLVLLQMASMDLLKTLKMRENAGENGKNSRLDLESVSGSDNRKRLSERAFMRG